MAEKPGGIAEDPMVDLFFIYLTNTLNITFFIILLLILEPLLKKYYSTTCIYRIWTILLIGLLLPIRAELMKPLIYLGLQQSPANSVINYEPIYINKPSGIFHTTTESINGRTLSDGTQSAFLSFIDRLPEKFLSILHNPDQLICFIWLLGCSLFILVNLISFIKYRKRLKKYLFPVTNEALQAEFQRCLKIISYQNFSQRSRPLGAFTPTFYLCPVIPGPMTIGIFRPKILIPDKSYEATDLNLLIRHELVHVRRKDALIKLILLFTLSLNWFNPLCYVLSMHINNWCEASCDELVLQQSTKSECIRYGQLLLKCVAAQSQQSFSFLTNFYGGKANMKQRLSLILNRGKKNTGKILLILFLCIITTTVVITVDQRTKSSTDIDTTSLDSPVATDSSDISITPEATTASAQTAKPKDASANNSTVIAETEKPAVTVDPDAALIADAKNNAGDASPSTLSSSSDIATNSSAKDKDTPTKDKDASSKDKDAQKQRDELVAIALAAEDTPYTWGGNDLKEGVDCSGLVQAVYKELGYELPRHSKEQYDESTDVSLEELLPGDLIFYDNRSKEINHVGIYIGDGQIIHAKNKRVGVDISDVNYRTPKCAGRIIKN